MTPRYALMHAARSRQVLGPILAAVLVLAGVYAYKPNDVESTWALTALLAMPLAAWLAVGVVRSEPAPSRAVAAAALGGAGAAERATARVAAGIALALTGVLLLYPLAIGAFDRPVDAGDVAAGFAAHLACAALGTQAGLAAAPPVSESAAAPLFAVIAALLASAALDGVAAPLAGPVSVAGALGRGDDGELAVAAAVTLVLAAALGAARARLVSRG